MTRREIVLKKLQTLSDDEVSEAIRQLTHHVRARLRFGSKSDRTKSGAHGEKNLGMNAIDFYVGESIRKLYEPNGWDWKFEKFTFAEQLMRIANKLISDEVDKYKNKLDELPVFNQGDISEMYDLHETTSDDTGIHEERYTKLIKLAHETTKDDDNLQYFVIRYFENASLQTIAEEMRLDIEKVYVLRKKLVRRLMNNSEELTDL